MSNKTLTSVQIKQFYLLLKELQVHIHVHQCLAQRMNKEEVYND